MTWFLKGLTAVVFALVLCTVSEAGRGGGHRGGMHHSGYRGNPGRGYRNASKGPGHAHRYYGRFSRRHWDGRFGRWTYFSPAYRRWYIWSADSVAWVPVDVDDSAIDDSDDDAGDGE
jgi:hypothetical protein